VAVTSQGANEIRRNFMRDNGGLGIDRDLNGIDPIDETNARVNAPTLLAATYDASTNKTIITAVVSVDGPYGRAFDLYANDGPDGDGETPIATTYPAFNPVRFEVPGDYRGKWINATVMRYTPVFAKPPDKLATQQVVYGLDKSTSELSNAVLVK
ncbi:MAG TPA: hypothetical protein VJZ00_06405, partial [Thermoanaerobaculia bacterium]|nr:hypothetical protein [Thermoanaerobaculia bacterium]